ncbi:MAG: DnaA/Hda family protein [Magnetococcus sp. MYC-9]
MSRTVAQPILNLPLDPVCTFANLVVGAGNRAAVDAVRALADDNSPSVLQSATALLLTGESGTGKTHLLQAAVCRRRLLAGEGAAIYLDIHALHAQLSHGGERELVCFLDRHEACQLVAVDDLDALPFSPLLQEGILYLFNRMRDRGGRLLVAGRASPQVLEGLRPDLRSRLLWGAVIALELPEDEMLGAILVKMVEDRQVRCGPELLKFLQLRLPRRIPDYVAALDRLNEASLGMKRPLSVPLAKEVLGL